MNGCTEVEPAMITPLLFGAQLNKQSDKKTTNARTFNYIQKARYVNFILLLYLSTRLLISVALDLAISPYNIVNAQAEKRIHPRQRSQGT